VAHLSLCSVAVSAAVGHSRGRGLLKFASGSPSPTGLNTRPPGQVQWVSEQWSPPAVLPGSTSPVQLGFTSKSPEASSRGAPLFSMTSPPPVPSHSTPTLSLHINHASGGGGNPAQVDLSPSGPGSPRFATKRSEAHSAAAFNGDIPIPLMTSASDPLPVPANASQATPVFRSPAPCVAKPQRVSPPHYVNIQPVLQSSPIVSSSPPLRTGQCWLIVFRN